MLGFIFGTVCLIGLVRVLRHAGYHHGPFGCRSYGYGYGRGPFGGAGPLGGMGRWGAGQRWFLRSLFERLETTPGQERAIVDALEELSRNRAPVHEEARRSREDLAGVVSTGLVDDHSLEDTFARHDRLAAQLRVSFIEALKKITEALDERQRKELAAMLQGRHFGSFRGSRGFGGARWDDPTGPMWA